MEWRDEGIVLATRPHGETGAILEAFSAERGRRLGLVRGGARGKRAAMLQPGAQVALRWRGRLEEHLGVYQVEPIRDRAAAVLDDPLRLAALSSICALLSRHLPEGEPQPSLYGPTIAALDALAEPENWPTVYAHWELLLLEALGFGLDLSACAATGGTQELIWVSPKSGRAVSRAAGAPYADRLLPLPGFLRLGGRCEGDEFAEALRLTGWFLRTRLAASIDEAEAPAARRRLARLATT